MSLLYKILDCAACRYSCREKDICNFGSELGEAVKLISRMFKRSIDDTLTFRYELFKKINEKIALRATLATVGLAVIAPYVENAAEDILLIPGRPIYITRGGVKIKTQQWAEASHIHSLLQLANLKYVEITTSKPSFRYGLRIGDIRLRISLDIPPVVPTPQAYIRIHGGKITVRQLLRGGFLNGSQLSTIYRALTGGLHIVITGPPGSGKTTLLAALDDLISPHLQRVYIDEADEFEEDPEKNQIKIRNSDKTREVYASLNRNIDLVVIGELQYEEHFHAFKTAVEIGVQTLATMHSANVNDAVDRLERYLPLRNILIVQLQKSPRRVTELYVK